jgi:Lar family restriction alleviation protein
MEMKLANCPFCGENAYTRKTVDDDGNLAWMIRCEECQAVLTAPSTREVSQLWNRRAAPVAPAQGFEEWWDKLSCVNKHYLEFRKIAEMAWNAALTGEKK